MYSDFRRCSVGPIHALSRSENTHDAFQHIGILNDYVRIPYAAGSSFAAQILHNEFSKRGHDVTLVGPRDPSSRPEELPERTVLFPGIPIRSQPGFFLPMPSYHGLKALANQGLDLILGQTGSELMDAGIWLRATQNVPLICVNTTLISAIYDTLLPERLSLNPTVQRICKDYIVPRAERACVKAYNNSDGLIVLSKGLETYWRELGVQVPIHVIPRSINPNVVQSRMGPDPFDPRTQRGYRVMVLCRHVREKGLSRILDIFARNIAPHVPEATLTLVGDGADHDSFKARAQQLGIADRCFWPGEFSVGDVRTWYAHGDVFVYASMSETYGQVVSEAMYCGLPVVAFDDNAGVAQQIRTSSDGYLLAPGPNVPKQNHEFGQTVVGLLQNPQARRKLAESAKQSAMNRADPDRIISMYYSAFKQARRHRDTVTIEPNLLKNQILPIARWTALHSLVGAISVVRPATILNRHGRKQPTWYKQPELESSPPTDSAPPEVAA
ncbi:MAG: glycosyltransferase [Myxococcales bacterium]|nr:glycosyltransferase [Myxococcales bacterium]